jgi:transcriptional regulator with XRE-family HTH domain
METIDLATLRARVAALRGQYGLLSEKSGMSISWISKFACGRYESPGLKSVQNLLSALSEIETENEDCAA